MDLHRIKHLLFARAKDRKKVRGDFLHKHRIIPGYQGGTYHKKNVVYLTVKEHRIIHYIMWRLHNHIYDLLAYKRLGGKHRLEITPEFRAIHKEYSSRGGNTNVKTGHLKKISRLGGLAQGKKNSLSGQVRAAGLIGAEKMSKPIMIEDQRYPSISAAARDYKLSHRTIRDRLYDSRYPSWNFT